MQVDKGAIRFIIGGANVMCPGFTSPGGALPEQLPVDTPVVSQERSLDYYYCSDYLFALVCFLKAIYVEGKKHAVAIGLTKMSTNDM